MILFYKNGNTLKIHNPSAETKYYQMPSVNSVLATEDDLTKVTTVSSAIKQPVILTPANNSTGFNGDITFTGFETIETFTGTLDAISIAIATDVNFANVVVLQRIDTTDTNGFNIAVDLSSSDLYIKVKYHSDLYSSVWSNVVKTTTPEYIINKPTIIGPTNGQTGVALFPMISGSDFTYVGVDETHESTTYQIAKDVTFTNIAYNVTSTTDLTSHLITEDLDYETTYYIRMRYNGSKYGNSEWSNTVVINTLEVDEKIIYHTFNIDGSTTEYGYNISTIIDEVSGFIYSCGYIGPSTNYSVVIYKYDMNYNLISYKVIKNGATTEQSMAYKLLLINSELFLIGHIRGVDNNSKGYIGKFDLNLTHIKSITIYPTANKLSRLRDAYSDGTNIFVIGYIYKADGLLKGTLIKLDKNLNIIKTQVLNYATNNVQFYNGGIDGNYIYTLGWYYNTNRYIAVLCKFDKELNLIIKKEIDFLEINSFLEFRSLKVYQNYIYIAGRIYLNNINYPVIAKCDLDLNLLNMKVLNNNLNLTSIFNKITIANDNIYASGYLMYPDKESGIIIQFDLDLNIVFNYNLIAPKGVLEIYDIIEYKNSIISAGLFSFSAANGYYGAFYSLDKNFNLNKPSTGDNDLEIKNINYTFLNANYNSVNGGLISEIITITPTIPTLTFTSPYTLTKTTYDL